MQISIAMATYNGADYIQEQLDSFSRQTRLPDELVVCDDGSTDQTIEILEAFKKIVAFNVRIHKNATNLGVVKNFEKALLLCTGDLISLSDQDDFWFEDKLETVEKIFLLNKEKMIVINDLVICHGDLRPTALTQIGNLRSIGLDEGCLITGCCTTIRKEWLKIALPIPVELHAHDNWINGLAVFTMSRLVYAKPLQYYRRHGANTSNHISSSTIPITVFDIFKTYGLKDARYGWLADISLSRLYINRLTDRLEDLKKYNLSELATESIVKLNKKINFLDNRVVLAATPRWKRWPLVIRFWVAGGYHYFSGWKSAFKDLIRP